jgi:hypothetical protein
MDRQGGNRSTVQKTLFFTLAHARIENQAG